ncbi:MAG TPA: bifunctional precorrin-2 dehydrogenase/sirohydrochlorin ferrochelatase [Candidatus Acidoferrum sp.]|nr:bifunctional precorrin-2 dehydrogenase/sirohydrochlorin ferrochelatase [Candidatus Acidoferrum sp.]
MSLFPAFLKLDGRQIIVIGGGNLAAAKIPGLLQANARVRVISPQINSAIVGLVRLQKIQWHRKLFSADDLKGAFLVIAATSLREVNAAVYQEADRRGILCNAVDDIESCHFYCGAIVQRGDLQIAVSTNGKSPALAQRLRQELEYQFGPEYAAWLEWLGAAREVLRSQAHEPEARKGRLHSVASRPMFERFIEQAGSGHGPLGGD